MSHSRIQHEHRDLAEVNLFLFAWDHTSSFVANFFPYSYRASMLRRNFILDFFQIFSHGFPSKSMHTWSLLSLCKYFSGYHPSQAYPYPPPPDVYPPPPQGHGHPPHGVYPPPQGPYPPPYQPPPGYQGYFNDQQRPYYPPPPLPPPGYHDHHCYGEDGCSGFFKGW
jgi:hypothetical protein